MNVFCILCMQIRILLLLRSFNLHAGKGKDEWRGRLKRCVASWAAFKTHRYIPLAQTDNAYIHHHHTIRLIDKSRKLIESKRRSHYWHKTRRYGDARGQATHVTCHFWHGTLLGKKVREEGGGRRLWGKRWVIEMLGYLKRLVHVRRSSDWRITVMPKYFCKKQNQFF